MKTRTIAVILTGLIAAAMLGSLVLPRGEALLKARIKWVPRTYTLDTVGVPALWNASIAGVDPTQVNLATITAFGETAGTPVPAIYGRVDLAGADDFIASFEGMAIRNLLWEIVLYHDYLSAPGRYRINIVVHGALSDGTEFQGSKPITVIIPVPPPSPPP
jgi:hypothetical protein